MRWDTCDKSEKNGQNRRIDYFGAKSFNYYQKNVASYCWATFFRIYEADSEMNINNSYIFMNNNALFVANYMIDLAEQSGKHLQPLKEWGIIYK